MTNTISSLARLSDAELLARVRTLTEHERRATARLIASLAALDVRRLYLAEGCSSLFTYCTQILHLSEHAAYGRIEAARASRRFPIIIQQLAEGSVTLTAISLLAPHLTADNHRHVLDRARHKSKRDVERIVAELRPQPAAPSTVRKLPAPTPPAPARAQPTPGAVRDEAPAPSAEFVPPSTMRPPVVRPMTPELYKVQFTVTRETYEKLRRAQDLLRHTIPNGDPAAIFDRALALLLADLSKNKLAAASRPQVGRPSKSGSRHIPAAIKRGVWKRDGGRCAFVGTCGRCTETGFLEFHHVVPFAAGGPTTAENLELRCRAHNAWEADEYFGLRGSSLAREVAPPYWKLPTRSGPSSWTILGCLGGLCGALPVTWVMVGSSRWT